MSDNLVVSVSREYGSGGREIAEKLAERLNMAYYDKLLIAKISEKSGFSDDVIENFDEKPIDRFSLSPNSFFAGIDGVLPVAAEVHKSEVATINQVADESPCVIVGRCADSVLHERPGLVRIFVSAPLPDRIARVMRRNDLGEKEAKTRIAKTDKARASYHDDFSSREWGDANLYDLCVDSSRLGIEGTVEVIVTYLRIFAEQNPHITTAGE